MAKATKPTNQQIMTVLEQILQELTAIRKDHAALAAQLRDIAGSTS